MRLLVITTIAALVALPALAGGNKGASATAVGVGVGVATGGAGGAATASGGSSGDNTIVGFPNANAASAVPAWKCGMSENRNILGIVAWGNSYESGNCVAGVKLELCREHWGSLSQGEKKACLALRTEFLVGKTPVKAPAPRAVRMEESDLCPGKDVCPIGEGGFWVGG